MGIPKVLYHGTTIGRWEIGIKHEGLKGDMPVHLKVDREHSGYVYLCENLQDSAFYAMLTYAYDKTVPNLQQVNAPAGVVLAVSTSHLRKEIELDPEQEECLIDYAKELSPGAFALSKRLYMRGKWYRIKKDIPAKYIVPLKVSPVEKQDKLMMDIIDEMAQTKVIEESIRKVLQGEGKIEN